jgi:hypothetical protein
LIPCRSLLTFCLTWRKAWKQGCQIFPDTIYQNEGKIPYYHNITKWPYNIPNDRKMFQMTIKYTSIFLSKALQNLPKFGFLVWK